MRGLRHIVLFRLRDGFEDRADSVVVMLRALGDGFDVQRWRVERSEDVRKGVVIVQDGVFADRAEFERFRRSDAHGEASVVMSRIADWLVADHEE